MLKPSAAAADPVEVHFWTDQLPDEYLECRRLGHDFRGTERGDTAHYSRKERAYVEIKLCRCCKAVECHNLVDPTNGDYIKHTLKYVEHDYLREKGAGRIGKGGNGMVRLAHLERQVPRRAPRHLRSVS